MNKDLIKSIPLIILIVTITLSFVRVVNSGYALFDKYYYGSSLIVLSLFLKIFSKSNIAFYLTGLTLLLGALNLVAFTVEITRKEIGISTGKINLNFLYQPFSLYVFLIWLALFFIFEFNNVFKR